MSRTRTAAAHSLPYMPGLDGLRAVAALAVFLYHMGFPWAAGGFLGVETFFVLSGYLITSLLLRDHRDYGRLRLGRFWLRRARRLWPALWLLLAGTVFLARLWAVDAWPRLKQDLPVAFTYTTNIAYIVRNVPYFARVGRPPLLQHLWSLAVEEQFYLFWPLVLWLLLRGLRVQVGRRGTGRLALAVGGLALASTVGMAAQYDPLGDPMRLYYGTDTRAAGFLLGGWLAVLWPPGGVPARRRLADALGWLGLLGLVLLYHRLDEFQDLLYRGGFLITALSSAMVVLAGAAPSTHLSRVLGHPIPRWVGTRSYAIYLWHWPLIAVFRPGFECRLPLPWCAVLLWVATCALAEGSYRLVEHPIRTQGFRAWGRGVWQRSRGWGAVGLSAAVALGLTWAMVSMEQINLRVGPSPLERALAADVQTSTPPGGTSTPAAGLAVLLGDGTATPEADPAPGSGGEVPFPLGGRPTPGSGRENWIPEESIPLPGTPTPRSSRATRTPEESVPPPGTPTSTPFPSGLQLTLLGDSIMLGTLPAWEETLPAGSFFMDAKQDRRLAHLLALIPMLARQHHLGPTVVIHLGTNGSFTDATFDAVMRLLLEHGVRQVYFVNVRSPVRWAPLANAQLEAGVARWPQAHLLDWNAYATPHREWFYEDFAHLAPEGARAYVAFILQGIGWLSPTTTQEAP